MYISYVSFLPRDAMLTSYMQSSSVRLSVRLSQAGIVPKPLNVGSRKMPYDSPGTLSFLVERSWRNSKRVTPDRGVNKRWGRLRLVIFSKMVQDRDIVTMEC